MMIIKMNNDAYAELRAAILGGALSGRLALHTANAQGHRDYHEVVDGAVSAARDLVGASEQIMSAVSESHVDPLFGVDVDTVVQRLRKSAQSQLLEAGGSFHTHYWEGIEALCNAFQCADSNNRRMMLAQFGHLFKVYAAIQAQEKPL